MKELEAEYNRGGLKALKDEIEFEQQAGKRGAYFVKLKGPGGGILYSKRPQWMRELEIRSIDNSTHWWLSLIRSAKGEQYLEIASSALPDGNTLQVGRSAVYRERLLERFRETFGGVIIVVIILGFGGGKIGRAHV